MKDLPGSFERRADAEERRERGAFVRTMIDVAKDFPDGAFWGFMQENGIDVDEVVEYSESEES